MKAEITKQKMKKHSLQEADPAAYQLYHRTAFILHRH